MAWTLYLKSLMRCRKKMLHRGKYLEMLEKQGEHPTFEREHGT